MPLANYTTNVFNIYDIGIVPRNDSAEALQEIQDVYALLETYCNNNIDESDIYVFSSHLQTSIIALKTKHLEEMSFVIKYIENNDVLYVHFGFE